MEFDRIKIKAALKEFDFELTKVSRPVKENKFEGVEKRQVKEGEGNPSDANFEQKREETTFKMKVVSNRRKASE